MMTGVCRVLLCLLAAFALISHHGGAGVGAAAGGRPRNLIDDQIVEALENFRAKMPEGWPELGIPPLDPLVIPTSPFNISSDDTHVYGSLTEVTMNLLSTFTIDLVQTNMLFLKIDLALGLPRVDIAGNYDILGKIGILPVYGEGSFWLDALNLGLTSVLDLGETEEGYFGVSTLDLDLTCNETDIHFEGIMGGGDMADFVNGVLSSLGLDFLASLEDHYLPLLEEALKYEINQILHGGKYQKDESVNNFFDILFANMRQNIIENGRDPFGLPEDRDNFTVELFNKTMEGEIFIGEGWLSGMSTVHRAGNMTLLYIGEEDEAIWGGEVGLIDLQTEYRLKLVLALFNKDLSLSLKISYLHVSFETDVFLHQNEIVFTNCSIAEMGPVHFKEHGAGPLDTPVYNLLANTLIGELHTLVTTIIENVVCTLLEEAFGATE